MIDPKSLKISNLPSVTLKDKKLLPESSGIYFAIDSQGTIQYIGRSIDINQRWKAHHRSQQLKDIGNIKIAYLLVSEESLLDVIESALIEWFQPKLNFTAIADHDNTNDNRVFPQKYGEVKKQKQFMLTETASNFLNTIAATRNVTRSEAVEQLIREEAKKQSFNNSIPT